MQPFVISDVQKDGREMKGVFAKQFIPAGTIVDFYEGRKLSKPQRAKELLVEAGNDAEQITRLSTYDYEIEVISIKPTVRSTTIVSPKSRNISIVICPVDINGLIMEEYREKLSLRINEASEKSDVLNVCRIVLNSTKCMVYMTIKDIQKGEELLTYYGKYYDRHYSYNRCHTDDFVTSSALYIEDNLIWIHDSLTDIAVYNLKKSLCERNVVEQTIKLEESKDMSSAMCGKRKRKSNPEKFNIESHSLFSQDSFVRYYKKKTSDEPYHIHPSS